jgi:hypothetical protein
MAQIMFVFPEWEKNRATLKGGEKPMKTDLSHSGKKRGKMKHPARRLSRAHRSHSHSANPLFRMANDLLYSISPPFM